MYVQKTLKTGKTVNNPGKNEADTDVHDRKEENIVHKSASAASSTLRGRKMTILSRLVSATAAWAPVTTCISDIW